MSSLSLNSLSFHRILFVLILNVISAYCDLSVIEPLARVSLGTLKYVAIVTRHGSRSPLSTFPNDPYPYDNFMFWPNGPNELTNLGKEQLYHTGGSIRKRYQGFINPFYHPNESEITYNPYNRDFMSSALIGAAMYPPVSPQVWDTKVRWQPVVLGLRDFDICDLATNNMCPMYKKLYNDVIEKFNEDTNKYKELLDYASMNAGMNYIKLSQMYDLYDTLLMQKQNGYTIPQWTAKIFPKIIRPIAVKYLHDTYAANMDQIKLGAGPELKYISDRLTMKANGTFGEDKRFYIESAHDCTLIALLAALGNKEPVEIKTGAYLQFELHYLPPNYLVQAFYYETSYDNTPSRINIDGCPNPCSLSNFNKFVESINPPDWNQSCQV